MVNSQAIKNVKIGDIVSATLNDGEKILSTVTYVMYDAMFVLGRTNMIRFADIRVIETNSTEGGE